ncbi:MAG: DNA repair protein RecO [Methylococcaceae bacterium]
MWTDPPASPRTVVDETGFILHLIPYRETSSLIDVFTRQYGRLRLLAKGNRKPGIRHTRPPPFTPLCLSWTGRSSLQVLTRFETTDAGYVLSSTALYCGLYLNELLLHLLPLGDPCPSIYSAYQNTLAELAQTGSLEPRLRYFELLLLESLGYGLSLEHSAKTGLPLREETLYSYVIEHGPEEASEPAVDTVHGSTLTGLKNRSLTDGLQLREAKRLMRRLIHHYTQGKPIRSRALFQTYNASTHT